MLSLKYDPWVDPSSVDKPGKVVILILNKIYRSRGLFACMSIDNKFC